MAVIDKKASYESRQVVSKLGCAGYFDMGGLRHNIPEYVTIWNGLQPAIAAKFDRVAPKENGVLNTEELKEGDIVLNPGFVYKKTFMTGMIMVAHLKAMKTFKPKTIITHEKDTGPAVDMGVVNLNDKDLS